MSPLLLASLLFAQTPTIRLTADTPPVVEVADASTGGTLILTVANAGPGTPAVLGTVTTVGNTLRFTPRFPLNPGLRYRATYTRPGQKPISTVLTVPKPPPGPPTTLAQVYPSTSRLPQNTLRLYLQFTAPMSRGDVYKYITLLDDRGQPVKNPPFLELAEELWSTDGTRFTLFFDPARVKRGLKPREEAGPPLEEGQRYTLRISGDWPDASGQPLRSGFDKTFTVGPMDSEMIDVANWGISLPAYRDSPLVIRLPKPLDRGLLQRLVTVADVNGTQVPGTLTVGGGERVLTFAPEKSWKVGRYHIVVDRRLEDPCGNRIGRAFELDETQPPPIEPETATVSRGFVVK